MGYHSTNLSRVSLEYVEIEFKLLDSWLKSCAVGTYIYKLTLNFNSTSCQLRIMLEGDSTILMLLIRITQALIINSARRWGHTFKESKVIVTFV